MGVTRHSRWIDSPSCKCLINDLWSPFRLNARLLIKLAGVLQNTITWSLLSATSITNESDSFLEEYGLILSFWSLIFFETPTAVPSMVSTSGCTMAGASWKMLIFDLWTFMPEFRRAPHPFQWKTRILRPFNSIYLLFYDRKSGHWSLISTCCVMDSTLTCPTVSTRPFEVEAMHLRLLCHHKETKGCEYVIIRQSKTSSVCIDICKLNCFTTSSLL